MIAITLLLGVSYLAVAIDALPSSSVSLVSEIARAVFPTGSSGAAMYYVVQGLTFAILILAANTSYQGFPRLAAILARDRYFPRQFVNLGDRLVYSNGVIVLAAIAARADLGLPRRRHLADPSVRDRRLHRVHAVAGGDGAALATREGAGLASPSRDQRRSARRRLGS